MERSTYEQFWRDGFLLAPGIFSAEEIALLLRTIEASERVKRQRRSMPDAEGLSSELALWFELANDALGAVSRHPRLVNTATELMGEPLYHWHSKVMLKLPQVGGAWEWHQDYGYWYNDNCLFPRMISCMVALDRATKDNGCLQVIPGSHQLGRIDHGVQGQQAGANPERVRAIQERLPVRFVEADPGSVLFFHCNTLHASDANRSEYPRRAYICCYNALSNIPFGGKGHGKPEPIVLAPDDALLQLLGSVMR